MTLYINLHVLKRQEWRVGGRGSNFANLGDNIVYGRPLTYTTGPWNEQEEKWKMSNIKDKFSKLAFALVNHCLPSSSTNLFKREMASN